MLAEGVPWFDDWFAIENVTPGVHAIGEPLYHWFNWNYFIEGQRSALCFSIPDQVCETFSSCHGP